MLALNFQYDDAMEHDFLLPVEINGKELEFPVRIVYTGYTRKFIVTVDDKALTVETDDSGELRVLAEDEKDIPDVATLQAIVTSLAQILSS